MWCIIELLQADNNLHLLISCQHGGRKSHCVLASVALHVWSDGWMKIKQACVLHSHLLEITSEKKKGPKWKVQEVIIRFEFSILCKDTKSWGCNCGCQVWWCLGRECVFAAFIMTISDKNWKGCVYRLHPVTSMHTFSNLCVEHLSLFLWLKISRNEKEPVKNRN